MAFIRRASTDDRKWNERSTTEHSPPVRGSSTGYFPACATLSRRYGLAQSCKHSPEEFAGVGVRSDLYSLGVALWEMVTGHVVFMGSPAEVMYQHQHALLPLDLLESRSTAGVVLLEVLLEKDPGRRLQNSAELTTCYGFLRVASNKSPFRQRADQIDLTNGELTVQGHRQTKFDKIPLLFGHGLPGVHHEQDVQTLRCSGEYPRYKHRLANIHIALQPKPIHSNF